MQGILFAQVANPTPTPTSGGGGGGGGGPVIDIGQLVNGIVNGILDGLSHTLTTWVNTLLDSLTSALRGSIVSFWTLLWSSSWNLLGTPDNLTIGFRPASILRIELISVVYSITFLAIVLLAIRALWRTMSGRGGTFAELIDGILLGALLSGLSTIILSQAFSLTQLASDAIGRIEYAPAFDPQTLLTLGPNLFIGAFIILVMLIYGWKLMVRAAYRLVLLMFLTPFAPVAGILWAIPQLRWVAVLYWVTMGGWLAGGILAIGAISLGIQLAVIGNGVWIIQLVFGVALVQLAYDLMGILPKNALGGISVGSPFGALLGLFGVGAVGVAATGAAATGAAAAAGGAAGGIGSALGGGSDVAGSLMAGSLPSGDQPGLGY